jgi:hypothetical protein
MRRYMTFTRIFLILSIINFARAAPVVVRGAHEVHVNVVDVAEDGTARSQKRWDSGPRDDWLANAADQTSAPTTPRLADLDHSGLHSPRSSTRSNNAPSSSALSTGPHPRSKDDSPPPSSWSPNYPPIPDYSLESWTDSPHPPRPYFSWESWLLADNSLPPSPDYSLPSSTLADSSHPPRPDNSHPLSPGYSPSSSSSTDHSPPSLLSTDHPLPPPLPPSPGYSASNSWLADESHSPSSWSPDYPPPSSSSTDHALSPSLPSTSGLHQSTDGYPPPSPEQPNPAVSESESESSDLLDKLLRGKIRRRILAPVL